jgi:hypothetical protein
MIMATRCYVGVVDAATGRCRLRLVLSDGYPAYMVPALRDVWSGTFDRDTSALVEALLARDWVHVGADITAGSHPADPSDRAVAGVGVALAADLADPDPVVVAPAVLARLDAQWIYLIDLAEATVSLVDPGAPTIPIARYRLAA